MVIVPVIAEMCSGRNALRIFACKSLLSFCQGGVCLQRQRLIGCEQFQQERQPAVVGVNCASERSRRILRNELIQRRAGYGGRCQCMRTKPQFRPGLRCGSVRTGDSRQMCTRPPGVRLQHGVQQLHARITPLIVTTGASTPISPKPQKPSVTPGDYAENAAIAPTLAAVTHTSTSG